MSNITIALFLVIYFAIGIVVAGVIDGNVCPDGSILLLVVFWPIVLGMLIIFTLIRWLYKLGTLLHK